MIITKNDNLFITVRKQSASSLSINNLPILAGAKIPLSQIQSFPITFAIGKSNLLFFPDNDYSSNESLSTQKQKQQQIWDAFIRPSDLEVMAKICPATSSINNDMEICTNSDAKFLGRGISKRLLLPVGLFDDEDHDDDDDASATTTPTIRASASIRLVRSSVPDRLFTW